ncbi:MAG: chromate transporter [Clostridia bacterium]|nr:chromate transporter [Clostridia bacterium]
MEQNLSRGRKLWTLFTSLLYISAFTFGGGFVIVTFMKRRFVDKLGWLDEQEMLDMTALAQSSPGPIALNAAIQVGWRVGGAVGMVIATIATILPPMIILTVVSIFYSAFANNEYVALVLKGMQAGVAAVIADVVCDLGGKVLKTKSWIHIALMLAAFIATYFLNINVIFVILASALIGVILSLIDRRKGAKKCD